jgi:hypothetical protein
MLDGDSSTTRVVSSLVQVLAIVVLGLVAAAVVTTVTDRQRSALLLAETAGALATVVLVAVVGWFASRLTSTAAESQRLRRRPYAKRIVATGIDRVLDWLETSREAWGVENPPNGMPVYPELDDVAVPEDVAADLAAEYPDLAEDVSALRTATREYREAWTTLVDDLAAHIRTDFEIAEGPAELRALAPEGHGHHAAAGVDPSQTPTAFVRDNARLFARYVLENPTVSVDGGTTLDPETYARLRVDQHRAAFVTLRGEEAVADQVDLVHRLLEDLKDDAEDIEAGLQDAREAFVEEYEFMETELGAVREDRRAL